MTAAGQVIQINKIGTVAILLSNAKTIRLYNVAHTSKCNSNLISFSQLRKNGILFRDDPMTITLTREEKVITYTKQKRDLFDLKLAAARAAMAIKSLNSKKTMAITGRE